MLALLIIKQTQVLYQEDSLDIKAVTTSVFALDSTTIDLCYHYFRGLIFAKRKWRSSCTPSSTFAAIYRFYHISKGKMPEVKVLDVMKFIADAFYVLDHAYLDFKQLHRIHQSGAFFTNRIHQTPFIAQTLGH